MYSEYKVFEKELDERLRPDVSFDIIKRELIIADRKSALYFIDGFIKDEVFEKMLEYLFKQTPEDMNGIDDMSRFSLDKMPYVEVDFTYDVQSAVTAVLSGPAVLIVEGVRGALVIDTRTYPVRGIEEPQKDRSLRGSRDGFVETLVFNTALIRRRIRTENLRMEYMQAGSNSKLDMAICYIEGLADEKTLNRLRERIKNMKIKSISMTQQAVSEALVPEGALNPFPKFRFTERPDYTSAAVLDGKIVLIMDNVPSVMILPESFADFFREADDYYCAPVAGSYTRIMRVLVAVFTVVATPLYLWLTNNPDRIPEWLMFIKAENSGEVPLFLQLLILEFVVDGLRLASLNTPDTLSNSLGIIGGLLLSEFAVSAGWFIGESILLTAFVTIAGFAQPSFEMGYAMKFERMVLILLTQFFGIFGFFAGIVGSLIVMANTKTLSGRCYLYPVFPFNGKAFLRMFIRPNIRDWH